MDVEMPHGMVPPEPFVFLYIPRRNQVCRRCTARREAGPASPRDRHLLELWCDRGQLGML